MWALLAEWIALPLHHKSSIRLLSAALMHNNEQGLGGRWFGICGQETLSNLRLLSYLEQQQGDEVLLGSMRGDKLCNKAGAGKRILLLSSLSDCFSVCVCEGLQEALMRVVINCCSYRRVWPLPALFVYTEQPVCCLFQNTPSGYNC